MAKRKLGVITLSDEEMDQPAWPGLGHNPAPAAKQSPAATIDADLKALCDEIADRYVPDARKAFWARRFADALQRGGDLSLVIPRFIVWLLSDPRIGVSRSAAQDAAALRAVGEVSRLFRALAGGTVIESWRWESSIEQASSAYDSAAYKPAQAARIAWIAARWKSPDHDVVLPGLAHSGAVMWAEAIVEEAGEKHGSDWLSGHSEKAYAAWGEQWRGRQPLLSPEQRRSEIFNDNLPIAQEAIALQLVEIIENGR